MADHPATIDSSADFAFMRAIWASPPRLQRGLFFDSPRTAFLIVTTVLSIGVLHLLSAYKSQGTNAAFVMLLVIATTYLTFGIRVVAEWLNTQLPQCYVMPAGSTEVGGGARTYDTLFDKSFDFPRYLYFAAGYGVFVATGGMLLNSCPSALETVPALGQVPAWLSECVLIDQWSNISFWMFLLLVNIPTGIAIITLICFLRLCGEITKSIIVGMDARRVNSQLTSVYYHAVFRTAIAALCYVSLSMLAILLSSMPVFNIMIIGYMLFSVGVVAIICGSALAPIVFHAAELKRRAYRLASDRLARRCRQMLEADDLSEDSARELETARQLHEVTRRLPILPMRVHGGFDILKVVFIAALPILVEKAVKALFGA